MYYQSPYDSSENTKGYFETVVEPLLTPGKEGDLCEWLKSVGLISREMKCQQPECGEETLTWSKARVVDKHNWCCPKCKKKVPIRQGSFLSEFKCDLSYAVRGIQSWCNSLPVEDICDQKSLKPNVAKRIYSQCSAVAEWYINNHPETSQLGGPEAVIIVDVFPDGCMMLTPHNNNYSKRILCIADTNHIPTRVWAKILDSKDNSKIVDAVLAHVMLGSTIVTSQGLYSDLLQVKGMTDIISTDALMSLDPLDDQKSLKNLETIWAMTVNVCQQIQELSNSNGEQLLRELQWRQIYGSSPLENILHHIVKYNAVNAPEKYALPSQTNHEILL